MNRIAVIGAGLAGLTAAYRLQEAGEDVTLFESSDSPGGRANSVYRNGFIIDTGATAIADSYASYIRLVAELGIRDQIVRQSTKVGIVRGDAVHLFDMDHLFASGLSTRLLSFGSKLKLARLARDVIKAKLSGQLNYADLRNAAPLDVESATDYAARCLNKEIEDYLVGPVIRTMLMTDADKVSKVELFSGVANIFMSKIMALKGGMGGLPALLAERMRILYDCPVSALRETDTGVEIDFVHASGTMETASFDAAVVACPLASAEALCGEAHQPLAKLASQLTYAPGMTVAVALKRAPKTPAFLVMIPTSEDAEIALAFLDHNKSPDRAPPGKGLIDFHWETGAAAGMANTPDEIIVKRTMETCRRLFPEVADAVEFTHVKRWKAALPLTGVGAYHAIAAFTHSMNEGGRVQFAGDYMSAAGQNTAVAMGDRAAERLRAVLVGRRKKVSA